MNDYVIIICFWFDQWPVQNRPELGLKYIRNLYDGVKRNLSQPYRFYCFTDNPQSLVNNTVGIRTLPIDPVKDFRWNLKKIFPYCPACGLPPGHRALLIDLDVLITGPLDRLFESDSMFITCQGVYRKKGIPGGSVSSFTTGDPDLYEYLWIPLEDKAKRLKLESITLGSERKHLRQFMPKNKMVFWDDVCPGAVISYKNDCRGSVVPVGRDASIIRFHGKPRPHEVNEPWIRNLWE